MVDDEPVTEETPLSPGATIRLGDVAISFEPNDDRLWAQIRLAAGAFMQNLFRQGAFQGTKASDAYEVRCDASTTTQNDINLGRVNVIVAFAPLRPTEFVVLVVRQLAGQVQV